MVSSASVSIVFLLPTSPTSYFPYFLLPINMPYLSIFIAEVSFTAPSFLPAASYRPLPGDVHVVMCPLACPRAHMHAHPLVLFQAMLAWAGERPDGL